MDFGSLKRPFVNLPFTTGDHTLVRGTPPWRTTALPLEGLHTLQKTFNILKKKILLSVPPKASEQHLSPSLSHAKHAERMALHPMPKDSQCESFHAAFDPEMPLLGILSRKSPLLYLE